MVTLITNVTNVNISNMELFSAGLYSYKWLLLDVLSVYEAVSGWGPGFGLGPKNVYFGETYFKDQIKATQIFRFIMTKM